MSATTRIHLLWIFFAGLIVFAGCGDSKIQMAYSQASSIHKLATETHELAEKLFDETADSKNAQLKLLAEQMLDKTEEMEVEAGDLADLLAPSDEDREPRHLHYE